MEKRDLKIMSQHSAIKNLYISQSDTERGWIIHVNGKTLHTQNDKVRVFMTLDAAVNIIKDAGIKDVLIKLKP